MNSSLRMPRTLQLASLKVPGPKAQANEPGFLGHLVPVCRAEAKSQTTKLTQTVQLKQPDSLVWIEML